MVEEIRGSIGLVPRQAIPFLHLMGLAFSQWVVVQGLIHLPAVPEDQPQQVMEPQRPPVAPVAYLEAQALAAVEAADRRPVH